MRRSIRKIAVAENASIAARKIIGARSLPVASWIFGTTACATNPPRLPTDLIAAKPAAAAAPVRKRPGSTQKNGWPAKIAAAAMHSAVNWSAGESIMSSEEHTYELQSLIRKSYAVFCMKTKKEKQTSEQT